MTSHDTGRIKSKGVAFACEQCKAGKRKCDGNKPQCSLCSRLRKPCTYPVETRPKKRKYWDEAYVRGLEQQVEALLAVLKQYETEFGVVPSAGVYPSSLILENDTGKQQPHDSRVVGSVDGAPIDPELAPRPENVDKLREHERSPVALEELSVMMWRMNLGDGATIIQDDKASVSYDIAMEKTMTSPHTTPPVQILRYCEDEKLLSRLANVFLDSINEEHQFTSYKTTSFLKNYPHQTVDETFLHTAILAIGAAFLSGREPEMTNVGEDFARYAERIVFDCCRHRATLPVIQGMCMLSARALALGKDHLGWMFISMAGGMCVHLRLHVLALDECAARARQPTPAEVQTFWMFYFVDVSAITILGRNCALPWRRVNVPEFHATLDVETADLGQLSFAWQCQLWYGHAAAMDQIFASSFETLPKPQQIRLLVSTLEQLNAFFRSRPHRLHMTQEAPKMVILFHLQYHMAILITISSFLRMFTSDHDADNDGAESRSALLVLRSITSSASETIRLCRLYRDKCSFANAHPIVVHHLLSAALVHLMNATSSDEGLRRQSARWLRTSMGLLSELRETWPTRTDKCIKVVCVLAQKWGVLGALPVEFAARVEPSTSKACSTYPEVLEHSASDKVDCQDDIGDWIDGGNGADVSQETLNLDTWAPGSMVSAAELLETFGSLSSLPDLRWLYENDVLDSL